MVLLLVVNVARDRIELRPRVRKRAAALPPFFAPVASARNTSQILRQNRRACLETTRGAVFGEKAGWRDEGGAARGHHRATPKAFASRAIADGLFPENPPGGGSFVRGRRWLAPY